MNVAGGIKVNMASGLWNYQNAQFLTTPKSIRQDSQIDY